jgi:hypothetical protein
MKYLFKVDTSSSDFYVAAYAIDGAVALAMEELKRMNDKTAEETDYEGPPDIITSIEVIGEISQPAVWKRA